MELLEEIRVLTTEVRRNREILSEIQQRIAKLEDQIVGNGKVAIFPRLQAIEIDAITLSKQRELDTAKLKKLNACIDELEKQQLRWKNIVIGVGIAWPIILGLLWYILVGLGAG
jgi:hypothetical protein